MAAYYNENDPFAAAWLRNLIAAGHIAAGDVDERSIVNVWPVDLLGYEQCHFFAGIGGWSYALRLAGVADDAGVWTGSCPCQPFSGAGKKKGFEDERHLWPEWFRLIRESRPPIIFGEQVDRAEIWLDAVFADLEAQDYACGAAILPACGVGAPHRRNRIWFVANTERGELWKQSGWSGGARGEETSLVAINGAKRHLADTTGVGRGERRPGRPSGVDQGLCNTESPLANTNSEPAIGAAITRGERDPWHTEPAVGRVVDGLSYQLAEPYLRAFGNAIVPQVAAEFIKAVMECQP
jgi:DNA (cytosine-5)-methyltransferase 1